MRKEIFLAILLKVLKDCTSKDFNEPGPAVYMPVQQIAHTYAACFVMRSGMSKIVISPIQRLFH